MQSNPPITTLADKNFEAATEVEVLKLMAKDRLFLSDYSEHLQPRLFRDQLKPIVKSMLKHWKVYGDTMPQDTLVQDLHFSVGSDTSEEQLVSLVTLIKAVYEEPQSPEYVKNAVNNFISIQRMEAAIRSSVDTLSEIDDKKEYDRIGEIVDVIVKAAEPITFAKPAFFFAEIDERTELRTKLISGEIIRTGIGTGIPPLDRLMPYGGLEPGMLGMVLAPTGRGKSVALKYFSYSAMLQGKKVAFFSLELPEEMLLDRMDSMVSGVPIMEIVAEHNAVREGIRFVAEMDHPKGLGEVAFVELPPMSSALTITNELNKLERSNHFQADVIVVDYMDLMGSTRKFKEGAWREQQEVARELRALGVRKNAVVWTASQTNRGAVNKVEEGKLISDAEAAESYSKQSVADLIFSLNQKKEEKDIPQDQKPMHLFVVKNRIGVGGSKISILTDFKRMNFYAGDYDGGQQNELDALNSGAFVEKV